MAAAGQYEAIILEGAARKYFIPMVAQAILEASEASPAEIDRINFGQHRLPDGSAFQIKVEPTAQRGTWLWTVVQQADNDA